MRLVVDLKNKQIFLKHKNYKILFKNFKDIYNDIKYLSIYLILLKNNLNNFKDSIKKTKEDVMKQAEKFMKEKKYSKKDYKILENIVIKKENYYPFKELLKINYLIEILFINGKSFYNEVVILKQEYENLMRYKQEFDKKTYKHFEKIYNFLIENVEYLKNKKIENILRL